jgi:heme exporter protein C
VFSIVGGAFVPLNFIAVRMAQSLAHPRTLSSTDNLPGPMAITFVMAIIAMTTLFVTLVKFELAAKQTRIQLGRLKRQLSGEPAGLPLTQRRSAAPQRL